MGCFFELGVRDLKFQTRLLKSYTSSIKMVCQTTNDTRIKRLGICSHRICPTFCILDCLSRVSELMKTHKVVSTIDAHT